MCVYDVAAVVVVTGCVWGEGGGGYTSVREFKVIPGPCQYQHNTTHTVGIVRSVMFLKNM